MAKNPPRDGHRNGAIRGRSQGQHPKTGDWTKRDADTGRFVDEKHDGTRVKAVRGEILFPTEPSTIGHKKIDRAVERVISRRK